MKHIAYSNGKFAPETEVVIPYRDRSFNRGDGSFDMTRTSAGRIFRLAEGPRDAHDRAGRPRRTLVRTRSAAITSIQLTIRTAGQCTARPPRLIHAASRKSSGTA